MQKEGFITDNFIPINKEGHLLNGAHRLSCATYLDIKKVPTQETDIPSPKPWGCESFNEKKFTHKELCSIYKSYLDMHKGNSYIALLYAPAIPHYEKIKTHIENIYKDTSVIGYVDISLEKIKNNNFIFKELLYDIYSTDPKCNNFHKMSNIDKKVKNLSSYEKKLRLLILNSDDNHIFDKCNTIKDSIRNLLADKIEKENYITIHTCDTQDELKIVYNTLLNNFSFNMLLQRDKNLLKNTELNNWLLDLRTLINEKYTFKNKDILIVDSSCIEVTGIRKSTDLDFTLKKEFRDKYFDSGVTHLNDYIDVVTEWYSRVNFNEDALSDDILIDNDNYHFWYRGFKFCSQEIVKQRKSIQGRTKDKKDVAIMNLKNKKTLSSKIKQFFYKII